MMSLYILSFFIVICILISTGAYTDRQKHKWDSPSSRMLRKKRKLEEQSERLLREQHAVLINADDKDLRWLLAQYELAGIEVSEWWLAGIRTWGYPPPLRSACAPDLQKKLDTYIRSWQ